MRLISLFIFRALLVLVLCAPIAVPASAQWYSDSTTNTPVCTAVSTQDSPKACSDGSDGVIVVWEDTRGGIGYRVFAQRLDKTGKALWTTNGNALAPNGNISQRFPVVASDTKGGAYVVWQDWRNSGSQGIDLYCQHIMPDGSLGWDSAARQLAGGSNDQTNPIITSDGLGNAFVVWEENNVSSTSQPDLSINKLTSSGVSWFGSTTILTNQAAKQRRAAICEDGSGGCYVAWDNSAENPIAIYGQHVDASGRQLWTTPYGLLIYKNPPSSLNPDSKNVALQRDGNQLLVAWETTNGSNSADGQDVYANRLLSNGTKLYYTAPGVTSNYPGNETNPVIFSDDSLENGQFPYNGFYVLFQSSFQNNHLGMVRMFADGITQIPKTNGTIITVTSTSIGINGFSAVACPPGSAIVAWNDSRTDSSIYAQRVDRATAKYFPSAAPSQWGEALSVHQTTKAGQVTLVPRTNGAIAVWTDWRNGNADIYSQLIFKNGTLPIELSSFSITSPNSARPEVDLYWQTASEENCAGFVIERREIAEGLDNAWTFVSDYSTSPALRGAGTSNSTRHYAYIDRDVQHAIYEYRLIDVSLDGEKRSHGTKLVEVGSNGQMSWSVGPNVPNPVEHSTSIPVVFAESAIVDVEISDVSGRVISRPISSRLFGAGAQSIALSGDALPVSSGMYFLSLTAADPTTGSILWRTPVPLEIAVMR